jgi:hypothetical protein
MKSAALGDQMRILSASLIALALFCEGCDRRTQSESQALSESVSYSDAERQERLKQALSSAGIPFDVVIEERNQEFIRWDATNSNAVERVKDSIFLPSGRNISLDEARQLRFKAWLQQRGIPFRTMKEHDREYIVWEDADAERVRAWDEFPSYYDNPPISTRP